MESRLTQVYHNGEVVRACPPHKDGDANVAQINTYLPLRTSHCLCFGHQVLFIGQSRLLVDRFSWLVTFVGCLFCDYLNSKFLSSSVVQTVGSFSGLGTSSWFRRFPRVQFALDLQVEPVFFCLHFLCAEIYNNFNNYHLLYFLVL